MDSKIQQLTETIYNEGVQSPRRGDELLKKAHQKAARDKKRKRRKLPWYSWKRRKKSQEFKEHVDSKSR